VILTIFDIFTKAMEVPGKASTVPVILNECACLPDRQEGSVDLPNDQILRYAQNDVNEAFVVFLLTNLNFP